MLSDLELSLPTTWGVATYPAGATYGPRILRDFEFVWIIEGSAQYCRGEMHYLEDVAQAQAGSILLCRPGIDFFLWDQTRRTRHAYFHFTVSSLPSDWPPVAQWPLLARTLPDEGDILLPLFRHLLTWAGRGDVRQCRLTMAALLSAFLTGETATGDVPRESLPPPVERALAYIHARLEEQPDAPLALADIADAACVTREHLCRLFTDATGRSPAETVRLARLDQAAVLPARSNYSVAETAAMCGFPNAFHFSRRFKDAFGMSPRALRQSVQSGETPPTPRLLRSAPARRASPGKE